MTAGDVRDQIEQLEVEIERLADTLERCRKAMLLSKFAIGAGAIWILAYALGAITLEPITMVAALAAVIGGVVVYGSNSSTSKQAAAVMKDAETLRATLIDKLNPLAVW